MLRVNLEALERLLRGRRVSVLTGAGCSTESGIPDYRGPETRRRARNPIQYRQFMRDPVARQRYWARAFVGWERFAGKSPNPGHHALASLEAAGVLTGLITQNVDGLHQAAGSRNVVELHGALRDVVCLECGAMHARAEVQAELQRRNPHWPYGRAQRAEMAPDGDAEVDSTRHFVVVECACCGGPLKPHVVFFGEGVPRMRVDRAWSMVEASDVLLVVGSSLAVFSGYRFVRGAAARGVEVAIVNLGATRGDPHAALRVDARAGAALPHLADVLRARRV